MSVKSYNGSGRRREKTGEGSAQSFLCKVRIGRRIRSSPSAVPPSCSSLYIFPPFDGSLAFFIRRHRLSPFDCRRALSNRRSSRCSSQRQSVSELSDEILKGRHKTEDRALRAVKRERKRDMRGGWGWRGSGGRPERKRGREAMRKSIRLYSKGGTIDVAAAASVGYDDEVIPSSLPQEVTSHLDVINTNISDSCDRFRR